MVVTEASQEDFKTIQRVAKETFFETFSGSNTEEDMQKYLAENFSDENIKAELANPESLFFVAWEREIPVGYLKVNTGNAQTELKDEVSLEIERIYVKSEFHGKKVGQLLYDKALEVAINQKKSYIWLGVWEENAKAIRFYEKNGFVVFDKHVFKFGNDEQIDLMMRKILL